MLIYKYLAATAFLFFTSTSHTVMVVKLADLHTMAKQSDVVLHGYVGDQRVVKDNMNRLITLTDVEVLDGIYGLKTGEVITIYQVGGEKDGLVMPLLGGHKYALGNEIIFFGLVLDGTYVSYGAGQGKLDIIEENLQAIVKEDLGNVIALGSGKSGQLFNPEPLLFENKDMLIDEIKLMVLEK